MVGLILGSVVLFIHDRLAASQGDYTSFCDVSEGLSCDVVLGSAYSEFLGIPVGAWGILSYLATAVLAVLVMRAPPARRLPLATALFGLTLGIFGISLYFFFVSAFVIGVACPICLSMDAVGIGLFGAALALLVEVSRESSSPFRPGPLAAAVGATLAVVVVLGVVQASDETTGGPMSVEGIKQKDPRFYAFYVSRPIVDPPIDESHPAGGAAITVVEFSDFQCPYCRRAFLDLTEVLATDGADVEVIHRNFPLNADCNAAIETRNHADACTAATASVCAVQSGKGSAFNLLLFENQTALSRDDLKGYASRVGLDTAQFEKCLDSPEAAAAVAKDVKAGQDAGVQSTPTFFINGRRVDGGFSRPEQYRYAFAIERERLARDSGPATAAR